MTLDKPLLPGTQEHRSLCGVWMGGSLPDQQLGVATASLSQGTGTLSTEQEGPERRGQ